MRKIAIFPAYFFICTISIAQDFSQSPTHNFKHINVQNGLTQNIVYHFLQDSRGYMWIGTHNGLNLYDGSRIINFLPNVDKKNLSWQSLKKILAKTQNA